MKPNDIPGEFMSAEELRTEQRKLLSREVKAIENIRAVLRSAIDAEDAAGLKVCSPYFRTALMLMGEASCDVALELFGGVEAVQAELERV